MQFFQADQLRGLTFGTATPAVGRRVLPTPMHDVAGTEQPVSENPPLPVGAPAGSVAIAADGRAVTYHLLDTTSGYTSLIRLACRHEDQPGGDHHQFFAPVETPAA